MTKKKILRVNFRVGCCWAIIIAENAPTALPSADCTVICFKNQSTECHHLTLSGDLRHK